MQQTVQPSEAFSGSNSDSFDLLPHDARTGKEYSSKAELLLSNQREAVLSGFNWSIETTQNETTYFRCSMAKRYGKEPSMQHSNKSRLNYYRVTECSARMEHRWVRGKNGEKLWICTAGNTHHNHSKKLRYYTRNPLNIIFDEETVAKMKRSVINQDQKAVGLRAYLLVEFPELDEENIIRPHHYQTFIAQARAEAKQATGDTSADETFRQDLEKLNTVHQIVVNPKDQIVSAFFALPICLNYAKCYNGVILVDCTYSVNYYHKPLLNMISFDELGNNFPIAFAIMHGEAEEDYEWAFEKLRRLLEQVGLPPPRVMMSDACVASLNASIKVFPNAAKMLCRWHIQQKVGEKAIKWIGDSKVRKRFLDQWAKIINSFTEREYDENVKSLSLDFGGEEFKELVSYLHKTWLSDHSKKFVKCFIDKFPHRNTMVSSRAKSFNNALKHSMNMKNLSLSHLLKRIERYTRRLNARLCVHRIRDQLLHLDTSKSTRPKAGEDREDIEKLALEYSEGKLNLGLLQYGWNWWMFDEVREQVASKILIGLYQYFVVMYGKTEPCTFSRHHITGLPCYHTMLECFQTGNPLRIVHFAPDRVNRDIKIESIYAHRCSEVVPSYPSKRQSFPTMAQAEFWEDLTSTNERSYELDTIKMQGKQRRAMPFLERSKNKRSRRGVKKSVARDSMMHPTLSRRDGAEPTQQIPNQELDSSFLDESHLESLAEDTSEHLDLHMGRDEEDEECAEDDEEDDMFSDEDLDFEDIDLDDPPADLESDEETSGSNAASNSDTDAPESGIEATTSVQEAPDLNLEDLPSEIAVEVGFFSKRPGVIKRCSVCKGTDHNKQACLEVHQPKRCRVSI